MDENQPTKQSFIYKGNDAHDNNVYSTSFFNDTRNAPCFVYPVNSVLNSIHCGVHNYIVIKESR